MPDPVGDDGLIVQRLTHYVREGDGQVVVRLGIAQAAGEVGLGSRVNQQDFLSSLGQSHAEIYTICRFSHTALLIDKDGDWGVHGSLPLFKSKTMYEKHLGLV